jgi:ParB family chromosome partitioning protein
MDDIQTSGSSAICNIEISLISPNPEQPRTTFDDEALKELATSIAEVGIIQPLTLRKIDDDKYQIISGERRYRAAKIAGIDSVPAYIREASDTELTEMALIENIQREDLNAIEIALTFKKLIDQYHLTQERLSERIGKKRTTIANFLRLLKLPAEIQLGLRDKKLDMGHARALLSVNNPALQLKLYNETLKKGLSVRQVEQLAKAYQDGQSEDDNNDKSTSSKHATSDFDILTKHLTKAFGVPVKLACNTSGKGKITFSFNSDEELDRIITIFDRLK